MADPIVLDRLRRMTGVTEAKWPNNTLEDYLELALVEDAFGKFPLDEGYIETFDLNIAAGKIFRDRAAEVADVAYDTQVDMTKAARSQIVANYLRMARFHEMHSTARSGSVSNIFAAGDPVPVDNTGVPNVL